jgi:putative transcriptional regulator
MVRINLAVLLAKKKWKQSDLVRMTGIRTNTINDMYHEFALSIKIEHINKICEALGCTAGELIEYIPDKQP